LPLAFDEAGWGAVVVARDSEREGYSEDELANARFLARQTLISFQNAMTFESVHELNYIDDMTGLYNHRYLELTLEREIHKAQVKEGTFAVLFIDIDHFKRINDTFGHPVGRLVLVELGKVLKNSVREMDVVARYGGDEFVVVTRLPPNMANKVARRILEQLRGHVFLGREGKKIKLTASIGLALYPEHATSTKDLVELADKAMYEGKKVGRDTVYLASDLTSDSKD
jgi:two-component system, cell cycle response regulator